MVPISVSIPKNLCSDNPTRSFFAQSLSLKHNWRRTLLITTVSRSGDPRLWARVCKLLVADCAGSFEWKFYTLKIGSFDQDSNQIFAKSIPFSRLSPFLIIVAGHFNVTQKSNYLFFYISLYFRFRSTICLSIWSGYKYFLLAIMCCVRPECAQCLWIINLTFAALSVWHPLWSRKFRLACECRAVP